jgi:hypothetical protein
MSILVSDLVADTRLMSDLKNNQVCTDAEIATYLSDAGSELYDIFTSTSDKYNVSTYDFTIQGGVGNNTAPLPANFQQGHSIDINPTSAQPYTLKYLSNWLDRNHHNGPFDIFSGNANLKQYCFLDTNIVIFPATNAAGSYRLYYTPTWTKLALPTTVTNTPVNVALPNAGGSTQGFGGSGTQFIVNSATPANIFLATDVGNQIHITGCTNPANNGTYTASAYLSGNAIGITPSAIDPSTYGTTAVATLIRSTHVVASSGTWLAAGFSPATQSVGDTLTVVGATNAGNNVVAFPILSVGNGFVTTATTGLVDEFLPTTAVITTQAQGTSPVLPLIFNPWSLYLKLHASITIRNKRDQGVEEFWVKLNALKTRITNILQNRQEEPMSPPLTRGSSSWWF